MLRQSNSACIASTSRHVLGSSSTYLGNVQPFSSSSIASSSSKGKNDPAKEEDLDRIKIPLEKLEKLQDSEDVGHNLTGGKVGPHSKRTLASFSMENKVCVVTGAARGLGNLMARTLIESGANQVAFLDLNQESADQAAKEAAQWFEEHGQVEKGVLDTIGVSCDVANEQSVKDAFDLIHSRWGRINTVINSAGIVENFPAEQYPTEKYRKLMGINVDGSWFVANEAARRMIADGTKDGSIVLVASMSASVVNVPQVQAPYNFSKAAVKHMASSMGVEWAQYNIRVNSLSPGYMYTNLTKVMIESTEEGKALRDEWERRTPMGRMGLPEDLKGAAIFLASDASKYVTSSDIIVDGGYSAV
ncbi:NAD(P)-binding protein [Meira miltonrushii]|uniref:NAD(P)-binding protein n=1 Tax=Meira miltonrushii TaxID=1280837 RepID=A0A316V4K7_9BASI|nr:NAD(P)-binding protein [Meira miltonrushii]PWN32392.1 NAD(P)-binding protein [Meira miltonrushii]